MHGVLGHQFIHKVGSFKGLIVSVQESVPAPDTLKEHNTPV